MIYWGRDFERPKNALRKLILGLDADESWKRQFGLMLDMMEFSQVDVELPTIEEVKRRIVFSKKRGFAISCMG